MFTRIPKDQKEFQRLIHREQNMFRWDKIVLMDDFFSCAVDPASQNGVALTKVFGENAKKLSWNLQYLMQRKLEHPVFSVPYSHLKDVAKTRMDPIIEAQVDVNMQHMRVYANKLKAYTNTFMHKKAQFSEKALKVSNDNIIFDAPNLEELKKVIRNELRGNTYQLAVCFGTIIHSMGMQSNPLMNTSGIQRLENAALKNREGGVLLDFWKQVNALDDYSHLYSNKPNIPKGPRPGKKNKEKRWDWLPGAAKPAQFKPTSL